MDQIFSQNLVRVSFFRTSMLGHEIMLNDMKSHEISAAFLKPTGLLHGN